MIEFVRRNVTIRKDQDEWLKEHAELNFSGWLQLQLDILMGQKEGA